MMFKFLTNWLDLQEPDFENESYSSIAKYLILFNQVECRYYKYVYKIGVFGLLFSIALLLLLIYLHGLSSLYNLKSYPSLICSSITVAFGKIELALKKNELYDKLRSIADENFSFDDLVDLPKSYKDWAWTELQELFKA